MLRSNLPSVAVLILALATSHCSNGASASNPWTASSTGFTMLAYGPGGGPPDAGRPAGSLVTFDLATKRLQGRYARANSTNVNPPMGPVDHVLTDAENTELIGLLNGLRTGTVQCAGPDGLVKELLVGAQTFTIGTDNSCSVSVNGSITNGESLIAFVERFVR